MAGAHLISKRYYSLDSRIVKVVLLRYQMPMINEPQTPDRIAELLVHVGRAARSEGAGSELTAAQWTCLRFLARANSTTRTPSCFASFQATTRGTASQIIKSLERMGLVTGTRSDRDRRSVSFDLTDQGRAMLAQDPLRDLIGVLDGFGTAERDRFLTTLSRLASTLAMHRDLPVFGTCQDCRHFASSGGTAYCACMAEELAAVDLPKLCASYTPTMEPLSQGDQNDAD
jgi:DNA-binding MarR family transcriptional regulator